MVLVTRVGQRKRYNGKNGKAAMFLCGMEARSLSVASDTSGESARIGHSKPRAYPIVTSLSQVPALLQAYQDVPCAPAPLLPPPFLHKTTHSSMKVLPHATAMQDSSHLNRMNFHLPDGPKWRVHDNVMRRTDHHAVTCTQRWQPRA